MHASKEVGALRHPNAPLWRLSRATAAVSVVPIAVIAAGQRRLERHHQYRTQAATAATIQAATITYSNDTTPSLSVRRRFTASRGLDVILQHKQEFPFVNLR